MTLLNSRVNPITAQKLNREAKTLNFLNTYLNHYDIALRVFILILALSLKIKTRMTLHIIWICSSYDRNISLWVLTFQILYLNVIRIFFQSYSWVQFYSFDIVWTGHQFRKVLILKRFVIILTQKCKIFVLFYILS